MTVELRGLPPFRDKAAEGWGTQFMGLERVGHPPAIPALLILVDRLCFDRYKIDYRLSDSRKLPLANAL